MVMEDKYYLAALSAVPKVGSVTLGKLVDVFGAGETIWRVATKDLIARSDLATETALNIDRFRKERPEAPQKIADKCRESGVKLYSLMDSPDYPAYLKQIYRPPLVLYVRGELRADDFCIGIVGTRQATAYGKSVAETMAKELAAAGVVVVSGAAYGIDTAAHIGALTAGRTIAVLGCGVDVSYPASNRNLLNEIAANGAVVSEYPLGTRPLSQNFPPRNRIISGMSRGVVVVEAGEKSGALITSDYANDENRDVFAVPGNIFSPFSRGCHKLINSGAKLVTCAEDILSEYECLKKAANAVKEKPMNVALELNEEERKIWGVLSYDTPLSPDEIIIKLNMDASDMSNLTTMLLTMEMTGAIVTVAGGYVRGVR